jgi:hypothetical protein
VLSRSAEVAKIGVIGNFPLAVSANHFSPSSDGCFYLTIRSQQQKVPLNRL